ncbi:adenylate kinase [Chitinimonas prasina]|uniref:Adenylate kinase n=1 Tax=Chitinimonas prasina TaxID=1434937 RepID=A0ABQ5YMQ0_9NEIS|nr:adenylate kinase [Chitinimonas prasina]
MVVAVQRIWVTATTGAGKTTLAHQLCARLGLQHIELDALHWEADWQPAAPTVFRERVAAAVAAPAWVVDGNYSAVRDLYAPHLQLVIWLDYGFFRNLWQLLGRTLRRVSRRERLWAGNQELLGKTLSRDSILLWFLQTYWRRRRELPLVLAGLAKQGVQIQRFDSPRQLQIWLDGFSVAVAQTPCSVGMQER